MELTAEISKYLKRKQFSCRVFLFQLVFNLWYQLVPSSSRDQKVIQLPETAKSVVIQNVPLRSMQKQDNNSAEASKLVRKMEQTFQTIMKNPIENNKIQFNNFFIETT